MQVPDEVVRLAERLGPFFVGSLSPFNNQAREVRFCCPFCPTHGKTEDDKWHLYVHIAQDYRYGRWKCHRCDHAGRTFEALATSVGVSVTGVPVPLDLVEAVEQIFKVTPPESEYVHRDVELPHGFETLEPDTIAFRYNLDRGLTTEDIKFYRLGIAPGPVRWRIIIPNPSLTGYDFWQARWYSPFEEAQVKYLSPTSAFASTILFNRLRVDPTKPIGVCEGPYSSMVMGRNSVATFGKNCSPVQLRLLLDLKASEYWIAYDGDAREAKIALSTTLFAKGRKVKLLRFGLEDDPASLGRQRVQEIGESSNYFDDLSIVEELLA